MRLHHTVWDRYGDVVSKSGEWVTVRFDGDKGVNCYEVDAPYIKLLDYEKKGGTMRYKNVEFRRAVVQTWQDESGNGNHASSERPPEIVAWQTSSNGEESCYTLCRFKEDKEGWYIETIGSRFTEYEDTEALMHVARYALRILDTEKEFKEGCCL